MATPDPDQYVRAQNGAVELAARALARFWSGQDLSDMVAARQALEAYWPFLIGQYGEVTATLAADRFEEITGRDAVMVRPVDEERANGRMRWALGPAFEGDTDASAALLAGLLDELVKQPGRSTLIASAAENGLRFARVPVGRTCAFCLMLGSRGFVYETRATAGERRKYHGDCDCRIAIEGEDVPGYDPEDLLDTYVIARDRAESGDPKAILSAMREIEDIN